MEVCFHYHFHPVGQGLFASGCLFHRDPQPKFLWVYDCGSASSNDNEFWDDLVGQLKVHSQGKDNINLMILSHFDKDHISGVAALLTQFHVDTLLLPYVPLWDRLVVAFSEGLPPDSAAMRYLIDPVRFFREDLGHGGRVILVLPSDGEVPPTPSEGGPSNMPGGSWMVDGRTKKTRPDDPDALEFGLATGASVELLPAGQALAVDGLWEFVPYNRPRRKAMPTGFIADVKRLREALLDGAGEGREAALEELKNLYETRLAKHARARNDISLFLYAGPVYPTWTTTELNFLDPWWAYPFILWEPYYYLGNGNLPPHERTDKCSILYSGDGFLDHKFNSNKFEHLQQYLGIERMTKLGVFQVCHHGAKDNWHSGWPRN